MDWSNERYVRLYVRDTKTWKLLGWEGQTVLCLLARRFDRSGLLDDVRDGEDVAIMIGYGFPESVAKIGLQRLLKREVFRLSESGLFWPNFMEAQETAMSDKQRQRESRANRRARALYGQLKPQSADLEITGDYTPEQARSMVNTAILNGVLVRGCCENCGDTKKIDAHHDDYSKPLKVRWLCKSCHKKLHEGDVTKCDERSQSNRSCHNATGDVTPYRTVPCSTVPNRTKSKSPRTRGSQLKNDWNPTDDHKKLAQQLGVDWQHEVAAFRDHALATGRTLKNWDAGFRNWLRQAKKFGGKSMTKTKHQQNMDFLRREMEEHCDGGDA